MAEDVLMPDVEKDYEHVLEAVRAIHARRLAKIKRELEYANAYLNRVMAQVDVLWKKNRALESTVADREYRMRQMSEEISALRRLVDALSYSNRALDATVADRDYRMSALNKKLNLQQGKIESLEYLLKQTTLELEDARFRHSWSQRKIDILETKISKYIHLVRVLGLEVEDARYRLHWAYEQRRSPKSSSIQNREANMRLRAMEATLADREYRLAHAYNRMAHLTEQYEGLMRDYEMQQATVDALRNRETQLLQEKYQLSHELDETHKNLANLQRKYEERWRELENEWLLWEPLITQHNLTPMRLSQIITENTMLRTKIEELKKAQTTLGDIMRHLTDQAERQGRQSEWQEERRNLFAIIAERERRIVELENEMERIRQSLGDSESGENTQGQHGLALEEEKLDELHEQQQQLIGSIQRLQDLILDLERRLARTEARLMLAKAEEEAHSAARNNAPLVEE